MEKTSNQDVNVARPLLSPKAPRTLDTAAPAYTRLAALFDHVDFATMAWCFINENQIGARMRTATGDVIEDWFTPEELRQVCPDLFKCIINDLEIDNRWVSRRSGTVLWRHCSEPTICIDITDDEEWYLRDLVSINAYNAATDTIIAKIEMYHVSIKKDTVNNLVNQVGTGLTGEKNDDTWLITQTSWLYMEKAQEINVAILENHWPGFGTRVKLGISVGLEKDELAQFAVSAKNNVRFQQEELIFPPIG